MKYFLSALSFLLLQYVGSVQAAAPESAAIDITQIPLEQLLETEFIPASRIARQISDAPSAVSIVTAQDIHDFGYRSLTEILRSMRGLYVTSSLGYDYLGGRGFGTPGDYAGRIMLMIDGYVTNDNFYNQIYLGEDGLLDVDIIERVEFIPGPGSVTYGNNAFLGVINIVTKSGRDIDSTQLAVGAGSNDAIRKRLTFGKQFDNGADILLSASNYRDAGYSTEFPSIAPDTDIDPIGKIRNKRLFFKGSYEGWTLELANVRRSLEKNIFVLTEDPADLDTVDTTIDKNRFISLKYDVDLNDQLKSSTHLYSGRYDFDYAVVIPGTSFDQLSTGKWRGVDFKFVGSWFDQHTLLFGIEYRDDYQQSYSDYLVDSFGSSEYTEQFDAHTTSLYVQDEFRLSDNFILTPGLRYDRHSEFDSNLSPRLAAIYHLQPGITLKLSHGKAFRYINRWEQLLNSDPNLPDSETVSTTELVWQQQFTSQTRLTVSLYHNKVSDAITTDYASLETLGQELGIEYVTANGFRLNASIAHQCAEDNQGQWLLNSPRWLGKLNIAQPLFQHRAMLGFELQTRSSRLDLNNDSIDSDTVANLTLSSSRLLADTDLSLTVRNLFDADQEDVLRKPWLSTLSRDGRNIWLQLEYNFR